MTIHEIKIAGFGKHSNLEFNFNEGVNIIYGENESGKSTIAAFIRAMLYGLSGRGVYSERKKYLPWDKSAKYGGEMSFEHKGVLYRITAEFAESKRSDNVTLYNDTTGEIIPVEQAKTIGEVALGIPAETYDLSVYAAQLSSKPDLDNGNMDYLFDQLVKKSDQMKQSASEIVVGKRIKTAMDFISSPRTEKGKIEVLQNTKKEIDSSVQKIYAMEIEAEQKRLEHDQLLGELNDIKGQHTSEKTDISVVAGAVETISLHDEIKKCVKKINTCDDALSEAAAKARKIVRPFTITYIAVMIISIICLLALLLSSYINRISFVAELNFYQNALKHKTTFCFAFIFVSMIFTIIYSVIRSIYIGRVRLHREELFELEEKLSSILNVEYIFSVKHHTSNREKINTALDKHSADYKKAKTILDAEENKNKIYNEHLAKVESYTQKIAYTKASADSLNKTVKELGDREELVKQSEEIAYKIKAYKNQLECLALAKDGLEEAYQRWQADLGPVFGNEAGILLSELTGGRYNDLRVARNFDITLRNEDGALCPSGNYSGATIDQMYLALRLALVKIISSQESLLPLILDDPFVQYDEKRECYAFDVICRFAEENHAQVILTTCRSCDYTNRNLSVIRLSDFKEKAEA